MLLLIFFKNKIIVIISVWFEINIVLFVFVIMVEEAGKVSSYSGFFENGQIEKESKVQLNKSNGFFVDKKSKKLDFLFEQIHEKITDSSEKTNHSTKQIRPSASYKGEATEKIERLSKTCLPADATIKKIISDFTEVRQNIIQKDFPKQTSAPFSHLLCFFQSKSIQNSRMHGPISTTSVADHRSEVSSETKHLSAATEACQDKQFASQTQLVSCGSVSLTSDNDYTFLTPPGKNSPSGGVKLRNQNSKTDGVKEAISTYTQLMGKIRPDYKVVDLAQESNTPSLRTLNPEQKINAINALAQADFNWFTALEKYANSQPQVVWDIRALEIEITKGLSQAINSTYINLSESDMVEKMNGAIREIFGKESGVLFDTNYYTAHAILQEGFTLSTPSMQQRWVKSNEMQSLVKVASNYKALYGNREAFFTFCKRSSVDDKAALQAWNKMEVRESAIEMHSQAAKEKAEGELKRLQQKLTKELAPEEGAQIKAKMRSIETKLGDEEQIKLEAMNNLYMSGLEFTEEKNKLYVGAQKLFDEKLNEFSSHLGQHQKEQLIKAVADGKWEEARALLYSKPAAGKERLTPSAAAVCLQVLQELKRGRDRAASDVVDVQMSTLLFANEPYYSQATVVAVVAGMQMKKTSSEYPLLGNAATYKFSMVENFGDFAKDKAHYSDDPEKFVFRSSKYLSRTISSAKQHMAKSADGNLKKEIEGLEKLSLELLAIRRSEEGDDKKKQKSMLLLNQHFEGQPNAASANIIDDFFIKVEALVAACCQEKGGA